MENFHLATTFNLLRDGSFPSRNIAVAWMCCEMENFHLATNFNLLRDGNFPSRNIAVAWMCCEMENFHLATHFNLLRDGNFPSRNGMVLAAFPPPSPHVPRAALHPIPGDVHPSPYVSRYHLANHPCPCIPSHAHHPTRHNRPPAPPPSPHPARSTDTADAPPRWIDHVSNALAT